MSRKADVPRKERNEYIPQFIAKKPFYVDDNDDSGAGDYLEHQRLQQKKDDKNKKWYDRGKRAGPAATKYRKGACGNCGAMTHSAKDCLSRPRKLGAKWTGKDIQPDEIIQDVQLSWDAKRDRWNGYDANDYRKVVEEYEEFEELKRQAREKEDKKRKLDSIEAADGVDGEAKKQKAETDGAEEGENGEEDVDEEALDHAKYTEESDMGRKQSTATRNLRIREDTAKYLLNLDLDSARYDPKTRRMLDKGAFEDDAAAALVEEEDFIRASGDATEFERTQKVAWESQEHATQGDKMHIQANPTATLFSKKVNEEVEAKRKEQKKALLARYGGEEHLQKPQIPED